MNSVNNVQARSSLQSLQAPVVAYLLDLCSLAKPKIIPLLLISMVCPMVVASGGTLDFPLVFWCLVAGLLTTSSANAINCIWDRDIDALMQRTRQRPLPSGRLSLGSALAFAILTGLAGIGIFLAKVNGHAAAWALFGHLFYVCVYTMWLKRTTPQNIVIGGAAGAVPPIVGWVAVSGSFDLVPIVLFAVVFLWTPPHFWALALNKNEDYRRAGVPMLPVVAGEKATHIQMLVYAVALIPAGFALVALCSSLGWFSAVVLTLLAGIFVGKIVRLRRVAASVDGDKHAAAWDVFGFSLVYLTMFFLCIVVDAAVI